MSSEEESGSEKSHSTISLDSNPLPEVEQRNELRNLNWTYLPAIRLLRLPLLGSIIHACGIAGIIGSVLAIAAIGGFLPNFELPVESHSGNSTTTTIYELSFIFGIGAWMMGYALAAIFSFRYLWERFPKGDALVVWHLLDLLYHLFRWIFFLGCLASNNRIAVAVGYYLELLIGFLIGSLLVIYLLFLFGYKTTNACISECRKELEVAGTGPQEQ